MKNIIYKISTWKNRLNDVKISKKVVLTLLLLTFFGTVTELIGLSLFLPIFQFLRMDGDINALIGESDLWRHAVDALQYLGLAVSLGGLLILSFFMFLIKHIVSFVKTLYEKSIDLRTIKIMRNELFLKYLYVNIGYQEKNTIGDFINILVVETNRAAIGIMMPVSLLGHIIILLGYMTVLFLLSWEMTIIAVFFSLVTVKIVSNWIYQSKVVGRNITKSNSELVSFVTPRVESLRVIRLSGTESFEIRKFKKIVKKQRDNFYKSAVLIAKNKSIIEPIVISLSLLFIYMSYTFFSMSIEEIGLYLVIIFRLMPLLKSTIGLYQGLESVEGSVESVLKEYFELDKNKEVNEGKEKIKDISNGIEINNVSFRYQESSSNVLSSINIFIKPGEMLAIVGPSGGGKSTLIDLIPRLRNRNSGVIKLNGVLIEKYALKSLRNMISYLPQSPQIFNGTIKDHICYGKKNITMNEIYDAAILSGADEFIMNLENGYDTFITDNALNISGGQRQRLDLARAIIRKDSKILILDEPSSSLDAESEEKFRSALTRIKSNKNLIIIMITHRLLNSCTADHIVVLNNGKVEDQGTHSELINSNGWYRNAWNYK